MMLGRVLLGIRANDDSHGVAGFGEWDSVLGIGAGEHPGDYRIAALVNGRGSFFVEADAAYGLNGNFFGLSGGIGLSRGNIALTRLAGSAVQVQALVDGLVNFFGGHFEHRADADGDGWS